MNIVLIGPPLSGKGTQANLLSKNYSFEHFAMGNLLRENNNLKDSLDKGLLISIDIIYKLVDDFLKRKSDNIVFDGFPRNLEQAYILNELLDKFKVNIVFNFIVDDVDLIINRSMNRYICDYCNFTSSGFLSECPVCKNKLTRRSDDNAETIKKRLQVFDEETKPLIDFYEDKGILININSNDSIENIYFKISQYMEIFFSNE